LEPPKGLARRVLVCGDAARLQGRDGQPDLAHIGLVSATACGGHRHHQESGLDGLSQNFPFRGDQAA
jgi:hypothetical protein